jgi:hypothetical protein
MAKTNIKGLDRFLERMKAAVSHFDDKFYLSIGAYVRDRIVQKARTGKTMKSGKDASLGKLSERYVEDRKRWAKQGRADLDKTFFKPSAKTSNLTLTGQYLKSIAITNINRVKRVLVIEPTDRTPRSDSRKNSDIAEGLAKQGRSVFGIDSTGRKVLKNMILREIRNQLRKNILRK